MYSRNSLALSLFALLSATALLAAPVSQNINACVGTSTGAVRIVPAGSVCNVGESAVTWAVVGPVGPTGAAGAVGAAGTNGSNGATGAVGATGATGSPGVNGAKGATGATGPAGPQGAVGATGPAGAATGFQWTASYTNAGLHGGQFSNSFVSPLANGYYIGLNAKEQYGSNGLTQVPASCTVTGIQLVARGSGAGDGSSDQINLYVLRNGIETSMAQGFGMATTADGDSATMTISYGAFAVGAGDTLQYFLQEETSSPTANPVVNFSTVLTCQ